MNVYGATIELSVMSCIRNRRLTRYREYAKHSGPILMTTKGTEDDHRWPCEATRQDHDANNLASFYMDDYQQGGVHLSRTYSRFCPWTPFLVFIRLSRMHPKRSSNAR